MSHLATRDLLAEICTVGGFAHFISALCDIYLSLPTTASEVELIRFTLSELQVCRARIIFSRPTEHSVYVSEKRFLGALREELLTLAREVGAAVAQEEESLPRRVGGGEQFGEWGELLAEICTIVGFAHFISTLCDIYLSLPTTAPEVELIRFTLSELQVCQARIFSRPTEHSVYVSERRVLGALRERLLNLAREVGVAVVQEEEESLPRRVGGSEQFGEWGGPRRWFEGGGVYGFRGYRVGFFNLW
ncbi:hypothetical protein HOY82DRAFT_542463 [Tuber indicum]|nr:hypothetical protein HOY82DRAFT_542463 [Tuber indicum]